MRGADGHFRENKANYNSLNLLIERAKKLSKKNQEPIVIPKGRNIGRTHCLEMYNKWYKEIFKLDESAREKV